VLASRSPRRRELLDALGVAYTTVHPEVEELVEGAPPSELVVENARRKAHAGLEVVAARDDGSRDLPALGVDTDVVLDGRILGKPAGESQARARLEALSGRTHEVLSGLALVSAGEGGGDRVERSGLARSEVEFRSLDAATIDLYLRSGEWLDRAGGYAVQGLGSLLIARIAGDVSNVIGLPLRLLLELAPELIPAR
jgi:septum formation protein